MIKYKKVIIIFSLILSVLFLNITPVYCSNNIGYFYILATSEQYNNSYFILNDNSYTIKIHNNVDDTILTGSFNKVGSLSSNKYYYSYRLNDYFKYNLDYDITYTVLILDSNGYTVYSLDVVNPSDYMYYFDLFTAYTPPEESTETTESTEETENNNNNIIVDNTEVLTELKEIKTYIIMFLGLFLLYFGYKVIKEISNKSLRR